MLLAAGVVVATALTSRCPAQNGRYPDTPPANMGAQADEERPPYKILDIHQTPGIGSIDYVTADSAGRRLYVPRGNQILVFNLDSFEKVGAISNATAHGVAVDPSSGHGFCSSSPVVMWDTKTLATITNIPVEGDPDGIFYEPYTGRVFVFSHTAPNATVIEGGSGTILGTIDLGGKPEQAVSDGEGSFYVDLEDKSSVAKVDARTLKVTARFDLQGNGQPAGLALDPKSHVLFVACRNPAVCLVVNTEDGGRITTTIPIGAGTDGAGFIAKTGEAFSSQRDGTLSFITERNRYTYEAGQILQTRPGAKTSTLDTANNHIILTAVERPPTTAGTDGGAAGNSAQTPTMLDIIVVGR